MKRLISFAICVAIGLSYSLYTCGVGAGLGGIALVAVGIDQIISGGMTLGTGKSGPSFFEYAGYSVGTAAGFSESTSQTIGAFTPGVLSFSLGLASRGLYKACFAAGTPIRTPDGAKAIEAFRVGDRVLSRSEFDPDGPIESKVVEELFVRQSLVWELRLGSRLIRTTAEHPFFRDGEWVNANLLRVGDRVRCESGMTVTVEGVRETSDLATVYNFRIADHHTYFVGDADDGTAVWAHNASYSSTPKAGGFQKHHIGQDAVFNILELYSYSKAPVVLLEGGSHIVGSPHYLASAVQASRNAALLASGLTTQSVMEGVRTARLALKAAGLSRPERTTLIGEFIAYLRTLPNVGAFTRVRIPPL